MTTDTAGLRGSSSDTGEGYRDGVPPTPETPAPANMLRLAVRGVGLAGAGYIGSQAINFAAYLVLARLLLPRAFGLYAAGTLITGIGGLFAESGMLAALITREDRLEEAVHTAFFTLLITGTTLMLASLALSPVVGLAFGSDSVTAVTAALSGWLLIRAMTIVPDALLQRRFSFLRRVVVDPLGTLAYAATAIPLAALGAGVWALVAGAYVSIVTQLIAAWIASGLRPKRRLASVAMWREMARFSRPLVIGEVLRRIAGQIDVFTLGRFSGQTPLGQYRNGMLLAQQPGAAFGAVAAYVILPAFARIASTPTRLTHAAERSFRTVMAAFVPVSAALIPLGVPFAVILLGPRWHLAGRVIAGLCGYALGGTLLSISGELLKSIGALRLQLVVNGLFLALTAVAVTVAIVLGGPFEVAVALSVSMMTTAVFALVAAARRLGLRGQALLSGATRPVIASAVMAVALWLLVRATGMIHRPEAIAILLLVMTAVIGALVYLAALLAVDPERRSTARALVARGRARA